MTPTAASPTGMSRPRLWLANAVIGGLLAVSAVAIVAQKEIWPFSPYPMFSKMRTGATVKRTWISGVAASGGEEFPLAADRYIYPLKKAVVKTALARVAERPDQAGRLRAMLADVLQRYEARRRAGLHDGPPLVAIRLYSMIWERDPGAANRDRPSTRKLLAEVRPGEAP